MKSMLATVLRSRLSVALSVFVITALTVGGVVYAAIPNKGVITGCYDKRGDLRIVNNSKDCSRKETALSWNQTGPQGPAGVSENSSLTCIACSPRDVMVRLKSASLKGVNLDFANLFGSDFYGQDFSNSSFVNAVLYGIIGRSANFTNANLTGANVRAGVPSANFTGANLTNTDFTGANLLGATFTDTTRSGVIWKYTTCPDNTYSDDNGGTCEGHLVP